MKKKIQFWKKNMPDIFVFADIFNSITPWMAETHGEKIGKNIDMDGEDFPFQMPMSVLIIRSNFRKMQNREPPAMERMQELICHVNVETLWNFFQEFLALHKPETPKECILKQCFELQNDKIRFKQYLFGEEEKKLILLNYMLMTEVFDRTGKDKFIYPFVFGILTERSVKCLEEYNLEQFAEAWGALHVERVSFEGSKMKGNSLEQDVLTIQEGYLNYVKLIYGLPEPAPELPPFYAEIALMGADEIQASFEAGAGDV